MHVLLIHQFYFFTFCFVAFIVLSQLQHIVKSRMKLPDTRREKRYNIIIDFTAEYNLCLVFFKNKVYICFLFYFVLCLLAEI